MKIFLGGKFFRSEFRTVERDVRLAAARFDAEVVAVESAPPFEIGRSTRCDSIPSDVDFFLLCRSFPNEFSPADVETLRRAAPLSPIALVAGALCEGENRTGESFPGTRRFYVADWRESGRREFFRFFAESSGLFASSPLETNVDRAAAPPRNRGVSAVSPPFFAAPREVEARSSERIVVFADSDPELGRFFRDFFADRGIDVRVESVLRPDAGGIANAEPTRIVVDSADLAAPNFVSYLRAVRAKYPATPIDVLALSPRVDEIEFFENAAVWGPVSVVAKPFDVDVLPTAPENCRSGRRLRFLG